jgi:hypothetical protein
LPDNIYCRAISAHAKYDCKNNFAEHGLNLLRAEILVCPPDRFVSTASCISTEYAVKEFYRKWSFNLSIPKAPDAGRRLPYRMLHRCCATILPVPKPMALRKIAVAPPAASCFFSRNQEAKWQLSIKFTPLSV